MIPVQVRTKVNEFLATFLTKAFLAPSQTVKYREKDFMFSKTTKFGIAVLTITFDT